VQVDTRDVLFVVGGAFVHLEKLLMDSRHKSSIGFGNKVGAAAAMHPLELSRLPCKVCLAWLHCLQCDMIGVAFGSPFMSCPCVLALKCCSPVLLPPAASVCCCVCS
jgi:hypothetical protein